MRCTADWDVHGNEYAVLVRPRATTSRVQRGSAGEVTRLALHRPRLVSARRPAQTLSQGFAEHLRLAGPRRHV